MALVRTWLSLLAIGAVACSSSGTWRRIETPHFELNTDLGSSDARHAGAALEATRDALVSAAFPTFKFADVKTKVYVLANGLDFERYFGRKTGGLFLHTTPPMFFLFGSPDRWELRRSAHRPDRSVLRHEMAHELSGEVWPNQPRWFAEGLANFLEPVFYSDDEKNVVLGGINYTALSCYRRVRTTTLSDVLTWKEGTGTLAMREAMGLYGYSWLFVHWLYHKHPEQFIHYMDALSRQEPDEAIKIVLAEFDANTLDQELYEYQRHGRFDDMLLPLLETPIDEAKLPEQLLSKAQVKDVNELMEKIGKMHTSPSHAEEKEEAHKEGEKSEGATNVPPPPAPPPRKKIDYSKLPQLEEYCGEPKAAAPAKTDGARGGLGVKGATVPAKMSTAARAGDKKGAAQAASDEPRGTLPPEVIQRTVRANYGGFRTCFDVALKNNADVGGTVKIRFVIDRDGSVRDATPVCGTTLPDPAAVTCIIDKVGKLHFPKPTDGVVGVVYPIMFTP